jgi:hypothetical protein
VQNGEIKESRIDQSVARILRMKYLMQNAGIGVPGTPEISVTEQ